MNTTFKKALINYAMIQTVIFATSVSVGAQIPNTEGVLIAIAFVWFFIFAVTLLPSLAVSILFAMLSK